MHSRMFNQPFMNVTSAVDTFFVDMLYSYLTWIKDIEKFKRFRISYFYISWYFQLAPMFYFYTSNYSYTIILSNGPLWHSTDFVESQIEWIPEVLYCSSLKTNKDVY